MMSARHTNTRKAAPAPRRPFWHADWRARLRAMLPELPAAIVAAACIVVVLTASSDTDLATTFVIALISQVLVQAAMYVFTYLADMGSHPWLPYAALLLVGIGPMFGVAFSHISTTLLGLPSLDTGLFSMIVFPVGAGVFWITRARPLFIFFVVELLSISDVLDEMTVAILPVHLAAMASIAILYVMRSSATRITMIFDERDLPETESDEQGGKTSALGLFGQVAGVAAAVVALCLAMSLAGLPLITRPENPPVATTQQETASAGESGQVDSAIEVSNNVQVNTGAASSSTRSTPPWWVLALVLLMLPTLPFAVHLLRRAHARRSLEHEPLAADRAARLYLGIIARLEAAGIMRDEAETPAEYLARNGAELERLVAPADMALSSWTTLTDTYERVRYAGASPTEEELATCWQLYDALPICLRKQLGWPRYLLGAFWRM